MSSSPHDPISSAHNPQFKRLLALATDNKARISEHAIWLEGEHLVQEAQAQGLLSQLIVPQSKAHLLNNFSATDSATVLTDALFKKLCSLDSAPQIAALARKPDTPALSQLQGLNIWLDNVQDPGNVGSIIRLAKAFNASAVWLSSGCANAFAPKVLRAAQGAQLRLPIYENIGLAQLQAAARASKAAIYATALNESAVPLSQLTVQRDCVWMFGNEGQGVSVASLNTANAVVYIDAANGFESLNVAQAAAICLYETARQASV